MSTLIIGRCPKSSDRETLRVFRHSVHVATFLNSSIINYHVNGKSGQIPYCDIELRGRKQARTVAMGDLIEFSKSRADGKQEWTFRGHIDGRRILGAKGRLGSVAIRARGLAAVLVDDGFRGEIGTTVSAAIADLARTSGLKTSADDGTRDLRAWINAASTFGALRLLGVNLGGIIRVDDENLALKSYGTIRKQLVSEPTTRIAGEIVLSSEITEGLPFRKRDE